MPLAMTKVKSVFVLIIILVIYATSIPAQASPEPAFMALMSRLIEDDQDSLTVTRYFQDERVHFIDQIVLANMVPRSNPDFYAGFLTDNQIEDGLNFLRRNKDDLDDLLEETLIDPEFVVAILKIESNLGRYPGKHQVFSTLATISSINDPVHWKHFADTSETLKSVDLQKRAVRRSEWAYKELNALLDVCQTYQWDPLEIEGSWAGAFGWVQFLPSSYARCGRDGNGDGKIQPNNIHDAIESLICYLQEANWSTSDTSIRRALRLYNPSSAYVECVFEYANRLRSLMNDELQSHP